MCRVHSETFVPATANTNVWFRGFTAACFGCTQTKPLFSTNEGDCEYASAYKTKATISACTIRHFLFNYKYAIILNWFLFRYNFIVAIWYRPRGQWNTRPDNEYPTLIANLVFDILIDKVQKNHYFKNGRRFQL